MVLGAAEPFATRNGQEPETTAVNLIVEDPAVAIPEFSSPCKLCTDFQAFDKLLWGVVRDAMIPEFYCKPMPPLLFGGIDLVSIDGAAVVLCRSGGDNSRVLHRDIKRFLRTARWVCKAESPECQGQASCAFPLLCPLPFHPAGNLLWFQKSL